MLRQSGSRAVLMWLAFAFVCLFPSVPVVGEESLESALQSIGNSLAKSMNASEIRKVAVAEFPDLNGYQSTLGQFIAEEMITTLSSQDEQFTFDVVERRQLARVLEEQELSVTGLFDSQSIAKLGQILGIDALITGSIADLGDRVKVNARAISVETAKVFASSSATIQKTSSVELLINQNSGTGLGTASSPAAVVQRGDVYFANDFLRIGVEMASRSADGHRINLALAFENLSVEDLIIGLDGPQAQNPLLVGNHGESSVHSSDAAGLPHVFLLDKEQCSTCTVISPRSRSIITFVFPFTEPVSGSVFSFGSTLVGFVNGEFRRFSAGLSGIEVPLSAGD